jgi:hypothetical protein
MPNMSRPKSEITALATPLRVRCTPLYPARGEGAAARNFVRPLNTGWISEMGPRDLAGGPYLLCGDWGQARVSKVAEREVGSGFDATGRATVRATRLAIHAVSKK